MSTLRTENVLLVILMNLLSEIPERKHILSEETNEKRSGYTIEQLIVAVFIVFSKSDYSLIR